MADKTSNGASGRSDLDPFAELTRIMGFDPRVPVEAGQSSLPSQPKQVSQPIQATPPVAVEPEPAEEDFSIDLEQELLGALDDDKPAVEAAVEPVPAVPQVIETAAEPVAEASAPDLDLQDIEDEISKHVDAFIAADRVEEPVAEAVEEIDQAVSAAPVADEPAEIEAEPAFDAEPEIVLEAGSDDHAVEETDEPTEELDLDRSLEEAFADSGAPQAAAREPDWEPAPFLSARPQLAAANRAADTAMADVDMDFDADSPQTEPDDGPDRLAAAELEAEYNALLGNVGEPIAVTEQPDQAPSRQREAEMRTASIVTAGWRRSAQVETNDEPRQTMAYARPQTVAQDDDDESEVEATLDADLADALEAAAAEPDDTEPQLAAANSEPIPEDPFAALAAMAAQYQTGPQENAWRETASKFEAPRAQAFEPAQPVQQKPYGAHPARPAMPDIETVDVHDGAVALADDLDIPDIRYEEPPVDRYDDLDAEFNNLLNEMSTGERREPSPQVYAPVQRQAAYVEQRPVQPPQPAPQYARAQPVPTQPAYRDDPYASISDQDFERAMAAFEADADDDADEDFAPPLAAVAQKRPRRGLWLAAVIGGLALIGGISAVALSFGSNGESVIAMIKADGKPVKIRPENPGGSTVPNQDSTVYDTVSRSSSDTGPTQERLVNTAEEPLDLPSPDDEEIDEIAASADAKDEDRVEATPDPELVNQETIAVTPRKVRTMVVKSDGTLVAREEPVVEPAPAEAPAVPQSAAEEVPGTEQITTGATKPSTPAAPEAVAVLPAALEKPAAAPAGGWSVQVSSQPSEDGANKSLKDISRKYAGVIGSRGANIVKAEVDGKGTMYRVRIPAGSRDEAISLCGDLKSAGGSCFVTK